ncbi:MAG: hypothetical protein JZD40_02135, partial [Sulfolobus sp.]|nr:hypothetical protein [Sulfolobus sp.]
MKSSTLIYVSISLLSLGLLTAYISIEPQWVEIVGYNYTNMATPPSGWQEYNWNVLVYGVPNATIITQNQTIYLKNVTLYTFNEPTKYVYIVSGYIQPYAYLSPLSLFLVLTGTFIGFKGTILFFQSKILG